MNTDQARQLDIATQCETPILHALYGTIRMEGSAAWRAIAESLASNLNLTMFCKDVEVQRIIAEEGARGGNAAKPHALLANPWLDVDVMEGIVENLVYDHSKSSHPLYCLAPFTVTKLMSPLHRALAGMEPMTPRCQNLYVKGMLNMLETTAGNIPEHLRPETTRLYYGLRAVREPNECAISRRFAEVGWDGRKLGILPIEAQDYDLFMKMYEGRNYVMWGDKKGTETFYAWQQYIKSLYSTAKAK